ncbi:MAG TPA: ATP-binding cassette domain-containing protein [Polyangiaceae bacterium]|nr:ATP-binding cassette domain-containing protein [Polyangiaceae bacterium]
MALLEVSDLSFGYTNEALFTGVALKLEAGERAGLVAPNGAGKSTLLRLLAGELEQDRGFVVPKKGAKIGYYRQSHEVKAQGSVMEVLLSGFGELVALRQALGAAQESAATGEAAALEKLSELDDQYHRAGADALERRVEAIALRLGFAGRDLERDVSTLSGGERGRLSLGVVLSGEPEILLLDEPTNHLDLETIRWLEQHLCAWRGAVLVVSHDRAFLDAVCPITMELGRTSFRVYPLPYTRYHEERAEDLERERRLAEEQAAFIEKTEDFIRRNMAGQKTKQAQSRQKMLEKLERVERPEDVWARAERVRFRFAEAPRSGDIVLEAKGLCAARGGKSLFSGIDLLVRRGDRIGIVGPNGSGKTTLLKLLAERGAPEDGGSVRRGTNLREGYFDQQLGSLDKAKTGVEEIRGVRGDLNVDGARQYLARFRFYGDDPLRKVSSLSGGESTRLALAKLLLEPRNLLFLDEPTNHLDIPAAEILEEALVGFEGTVLLVSHDRRFLETVTTRTLNLTPGAVDLYEGGFKDYGDALERKRRADSAAREREAAKTSAGKAAAARAPTKPAPEPKAGPQEHQARRAASRELQRKRRRVQELEKQIAELEATLQSFKEELKASDGSNWERLHDLALKDREYSELLDRAMKEWVSLSEELSSLAEPETGARQ